MQRILVIGPGGAGKSTFSRVLATRLGLPVIHLDALYWRAGSEPTAADEWRAVVHGLLARERWVMDGNYGGTLDVRLAACDAVIFLDLPRWVCLAGVFERWVRFVVGRGAPLPAGNPGRVTWSFVQWIWTYRRRRRPDVLRRLASLPADRRVVILRSRRAMARFLESIDAGPTPDRTRTAV